MMFFPLERHLRTPTDLNVEYSDVFFNSNDGTSLHGWFLPGKGKVKASILFLHGNAQNISTHLSSVYWLPKHGYNVFLFDYRGFGKSHGKPDLDGIIGDADAAISLVSSLKETQQFPIIVYGQSIGAAISSYAVAHASYRHKVDAIIIESSFSSYREIAKEKFAEIWLTWPFQYPLSWFFSDRYKPIDAVPLLSPIPILFIYAKTDRIIPVHHGEYLYAAAIEPKEFWLIENGQHIDIFFQQERRERLLKYLSTVKKRTP